MLSSKKLTVLTLLLLACYCGQAQEKKDSVITLKHPGAVTINGEVTDAATGKPLSGISVRFKDYSAAISDSLGKFKLKLPSKKVAIVLEGESYQTKEVAVGGKDHIRADLYEDTYNSFFDQAVLPFGPQFKSHVPYAVSSVQTNGNWDKISETPESYLQGRVAGLNVTRRSGTPNIGATLSLRGFSSLYGTNQPLIVVDGVLFDNQDYGGSIISNHYSDPLSTIDVRDIDNITVIKDGSSTYGTKGANGVILITTARAKQLGTRIDFALYGGVNFTPSNIPVMNASDYRIYLSEILKSKGMTDADIQALPYMNDNPSNPEYYRYHNNTNWQGLVFKRSYTQNVYLKVTGGDNIAKYALSLGYMGNGSVTKNTDLTRYNMRFNGDLNLSKRMTATTNLSFGFNEQNVRDQGASPKTNPIFLALTKSPLLRYKDVSDKGIESPSLADRDTFNTTNPIAITDVAQGINKSYRFLGSIGFDYKISRTLSLATTVGVTNDKVRENFFIPRKGVTTDTLPTDIVFSRLGSQVKSLFALYNDSRISYNRRFHRIHELSARLGVRYLYSKAEQDIGFGYNSAIDELVSVGNGVNSLRRVGGSIGESKWMNTYFNTDYNYADKYFISVNVAMDGSSRFGKEIPSALAINQNKYAVLPSIAAAWLISSDLREIRNIDLLKLRASFGLSGNDDIGNYSSKQTYVSQNLLGMEGLVRGGVGNSQLQWEQVKKFDIGVDGALYNERINFSVDFYHNRTSRMITYEQAPVASGFTYAISNSGAMYTNGMDASFNLRLINRAAFKWDLGFIIGTSRSVVDRLPADRVINSFAGAGYITQPGHVPNLFYGYSTSGVYVSDAVAANEGLSIRKPDGTLVPFKGGDVRFTDLNGDKVIDDNDRTVIGDPNPDYFGSVSNRFEYKRFSLDALFTYSVGNDIYNYTRNQLESMTGFGNQTEAVINRWRDNGQITEVPKATWGDPMGNSRFSDRWIEDGTYLRLRTLTLSYNLPFRPGFFKYGVIYLTGNNVFTLTKYKGYDPEFSATESIFGRGVDNTLEPQFKSMQLGLRIGL